MRRVLVLTSAVLVALSAAGVARTTRPPVPSTGVIAPVAAPVSWADLQISAVTAAGILGTDPASFRPTDPLTRGELAEATRRGSSR